MSRQYIFGEWIEKSLTIDDVKGLCERARARQAMIRDYPLDRIFATFRKLQAKWSDPNYPLRKKLLAELPSETGFSSEMIELALQEVAWTLEPSLLKKKIETELQGVWPEGKFIPETQRYLNWQPLGTVLHVLSGNVFLVAIGSFVEGLITGNVNILKMASGEKVFLPVFIESLRECDTDGVILNSLAVVEYPSSDRDVLETFKAEVDGIVVWGGEDAVRSYRNNLPARTKCIVFGPKLSVGLISKNGLSEQGVEATATRLADEIVIWDQNACTAPQVCFVEGEENANQLAHALAVALNEKNKALPPGPSELNTAVEIQKWRGVAEIAESRGAGKVLTSPDGVDWTVIVEKSTTVEPSPLHRTLKIKPYADLNAVVTELTKLHGYIQTVGMVVAKSEMIEVSRTMARAGALRLVTMGEMAGGQIDDPHDGAYDLNQYGHFVFTSTTALPEGLDPTDCLPPEEKGRRINARLRNLVDRARLSPFYKKRLEGIEINGVEDLPHLAVLTREEMDLNMPPQVGVGEGLATLKNRTSGGYVSRSGGSSGKPKFSIYDEADWEKMISQAVKVLRAAGVSPQDRIANCMLAGDLYGSFVSFDHINCRIGAQTFAFAGGVTAENLVEMQAKFDINVIQGMPTVLIPLLKKARTLSSEFKMEKVIYAGIPLAPSDRKWLKEVLGVKRIASIIGANDGGQLAFQCEHLEGTFHHLVEDFNFVEIVDEKYQPVKDGVAGTLLITSLEKYAFPLIRYEVGDAGKIISEKCSCGRNNRIIEYLGRSDDALSIGLLNLRFRDIQEALREFPISVLQMVGRLEEGEYLVLKAECQDPVPGMAEEIRKRLDEAIPKLKQALDCGDLRRLEVEILSPGTIERNPRTGKVKQWLDERK
jgi:phenylacetate-CoA ligase